MRLPKNPFHPGEILLEEFLIPGGTSQAAFAKRIGWTKAKLNELIKGKRNITAATALDLAKILGTSPKVWMNLQATYDLDVARKKKKPRSWMSDVNAFNFCLPSSALRHLVLFPSTEFRVPGFLPFLPAIHGGSHGG